MKIWSRLVAVKAVDFRAWLVTTLALSIFTSMILSTSIGGTVQWWLLTVAVAQGLIGLFLVVADKTYLRGKLIGDAPVLSLLTLIVAAICYPLIVYYFGRIGAEFEELSVRLPRSILSAFSHVAWYLTAAAIFQSFKRYRDSYQSLRAQLDIEKNLEAIAVVELEQYRQRVANEVKATLNRAFSRLLEFQSAKSSDLHDLLDQVVKPLGRKLAGREPDADELSLGKAVQPTSKIRVAWLLSRLAFVTPFNFAITPPIMAMATFGLKIWASNIELAARSTVMNFLFLTGALFLADQVHKRGKAKTSRTVWLIFATSASLGIAILDGAVTSYAIGNARPGYIWLFTLQNLLVMFVVSAVRGFAIERRAILEQLDSAVQRVAWMNARIGQLIWVEKRRLSRLVHGDIQARIMATSLSIDVSKPTDEATKELLQKLSDDCEAALLKPIQNSSLTDFIESMKKIWKASVLIEANISDEAMMLLGNDGPAVDAVVEIIREGVNNAVKHGAATHVTIGAKVSVFEKSGEVREVGLLEVEVLDNGLKQHGNEMNPAGLGSALLDQLTLDWKLTIGAGATSLSARVPLRSNS